MEPWEALDLEYSDLKSLLRPQKRQRSPQRLSDSTAAAGISSQFLPILKPCSRPPFQFQSSSENRESDSNSSPQDLICESQRISTQLEASCSSSASTRVIPGPAGAVQAAMQRRIRGDNSFSVCDEEFVPTQEYIRRVIENGVEEDDDFNGNAWLCGLDFVRGLGSIEGNGTVLETPLNSIKKGFNAEKIALVVAIIKSCTSNGLGDMMVTLKDPTGTMDSSIHHKVVSEGNFGRSLSVGAVLILQKVAVFSPTRFVHVLNVTSNNVLKVISKDTGPPIKPHYPASASKQLGPATEETHRGEVHMVVHKETFSMSLERTENIMNNLMMQTSKLRGSGVGDAGAGKSNCKGKENNRKQQTVLEENGLGKNLGAWNSTFLTEIDAETGVDEHVNQCRATDTEKPLERAQENGAKLKFNPQVPNNQEAENMNAAGKTHTRTPLPEWTDEQLDELFAFD